MRWSMFRSTTTSWRLSTLSLGRHRKRVASRAARNSTPITLYAEDVIRQGLDPFAINTG